MRYFQPDISISTNSRVSPMKNSMLSRFRLPLPTRFNAMRRQFLVHTGALALMIAFGAASAFAQEDRPVTVFAAASMKNALEEIVALWKAETGNEAVLSFAGSSLLARQILQDAPADLYISANVQWMDEVEKANRLAPGTRRYLVSNRLVLVSAGNKRNEIDLTPDLDLAGLLDGGKLAMALVDAVPAGQYGKAALENLGMWEAVAPHVVQADNVRAALQYVATGEAPYGIVYASDAVAEPRVFVASVFPADSHPPIRYPVAMLKQGDRAQTRSLLGFLASDEAGNVFLKHGFFPLPGGDS